MEEGREIRSEQEREGEALNPAGALGSSSHDVSTCRQGGGGEGFCGWEREREVRGGEEGTADLRLTIHTQIQTHTHTHTHTQIHTRGGEGGTNRRKAHNTHTQT